MTMRKRANLSLAVLALLFVTLLVVQNVYEKTWWSQALLFVVESGMVGALADWFAVTALFRHPLGLKWLPHTAIVAKNRSKLIDGVVKLVEEQLLDKEMIKRQLTQFQFVPLLVQGLGHNPLEKFDERQIKQWIAQMIHRFFSESKTEKLEQKLISILNEQSLARWLATAIKVVKRNHLDQKLINQLLLLAEKRLLQPDILPWIKQLLEEEANQLTAGESGGWLARMLFSFAEATNAVNLDDAAKVIYHDLLKLVKELHEEEHEIRILLDEHLLKFVKQLEENEQATEVIKSWTNGLIQQLKLSSWLPKWMEQAFHVYEEEAASMPLELLFKSLKKMLQSLWQWLSNDQQAQAKLEEHLQSFFIYLIEHEYKLVGQIARGTLESFSEERLIQFIESKVETDLQRIRLNGAVIGSAVGAMLYLLLYGIYEPLLKLL